MTERKPQSDDKPREAIVANTKAKSLLPSPSKRPTEWSARATDSKSHVLVCSDHIDW